MPTNNDQVIKKRKRKPPSKTVNEFTSEDWDRYPPRKPTTFLKPGLAVRELRKDLRLMKRLAAEAMKKQAAMERKQVQDYMLCPQTEQTQESFDAGRLVLLRDLRIKVGRKLGYVPIALGGVGSPWLMKGRDGPPAIPEPWELRDGTGDSPMERHIAAEHEEIEWGNKYFDGLFALFCVSQIPLRRFYRHEVCPVFSRMETRISGDHYDPFYEKWYTKLRVLSVEMREFEARTKTVEHRQTQPVATGNKRSGRKRDRAIGNRNKEIAALAVSGKEPLEIAKILDAQKNLDGQQKYSVPKSWMIVEDDGTPYSVKNFEKAYYDPHLRKKFYGLIYYCKKSCAKVLG